MNKSILSDKKLENQLGLGLGVLALLILGILGVTGYLTASKQLRLGFDQKLQTLLQAASAHIHPAMQDLVKDDTTQDLQSLQIVRQGWMELINTDPDIQAIYFLQLTPDGNPEVLSAASNASNPAWSPGVSQIQASLETIQELPLLKQAWIEPKFTMQGRDAILSGYVPISSSQGESTGWLRIDLNANSVLHSEQRLFWLFLALFVVGVAVFTGAGWLVGHSTSTPLKTITQAIQHVSAGDLSYQVHLDRLDEIGRMAQQFNHMSANISEIVTNLEYRIVEHTHSLAQYTSYIKTIAEAGYIASTDQAGNQLIQQFVDLVQDRFNLRSVRLYLVDPNREWAKLQAASDLIGRQTPGQRVRVGEGIVGWCIANNQAQVNHNTVEETASRYLAEPLLSQTEAALPLRVRGQAIGALNITTINPEGLDQFAIFALQTISDQFGTALENARLFTENQANIETLRQAYGEVSRQAWSDLLHSRPDISYRYDAHGLHQIGEELESDNGLRENGEMESPNGLAALSLPIRLRGQSLGTIDLHKTPSAGEWTKDEIAFLQALSDQLGAALESARLYQETQRRAERERLAGEITAKVRASNDPQTILQTAVKELRQALQAKRAQILVSPESIPPDQLSQETASTAGVQSKGDNQTDWNEG